MRIVLRASTVYYQRLLVDNMENAMLMMANAIVLQVGVASTV